MILAGTTTQVSFKVNVLGTSAEPRVRVILGTTPELSFNATQVDDKWSVPLAVPATCAAGSYPLRVEVILNGRLFTPITKSIQIDSTAGAPIETAPAQAVQAPVVAPTQPVAATPAPAQTPPAQPQTISLMSLVAAAKPDVQQTIEMPKVVAKMPKPVAKLPKVAAPAPAVVAKPIELPPAPELQSLKVEATKRRFAPIRTPMPTSESVENKPVVVKMSDIDVAAEKFAVTPIQEVRIDQPSMSAKTPIKLVKEELFYE